MSWFARARRSRLSEDVQTLSKRLPEKRARIATASTESIRKSRQGEADRLERDLLWAEAKVIDQDTVIAALQTKIGKEEDAEHKKRVQADARREKDRILRDAVVTCNLQALTETTSALDARLTEVEESSLILSHKPLRATRCGVSTTCSCPSPHPM